MQNRSALKTQESLFNIGTKLQEKELLEFNDALKKEIRSRGHEPIEAQAEPEVPELERTVTLPAIQTKILFKPFLSFSTAVKQPSAHIKAKIVNINLCFSEKIPSPPNLPETEVQKAFAGAPDAVWQVPMYTSTPRFVADSVVFDSIVNNSLFQRANLDNDTLLYLIELSFEWVEDKFHILLDRAYTTNPTSYFGKMAIHFLQEAVSVPEDTSTSTSHQRLNARKPSEGLALEASKTTKTVKSPTASLLKKVEANSSLVLAFKVDIQDELYLDPKINIQAGTLSLFKQANAAGKLDISKFNIFKHGYKQLSTHGYYITTESKLVLYISRN